MNLCSMSPAFHKTFYEVEMLLFLHRALIGKCTIVVEMLLLLWQVTVHLGTKHQNTISFVTIRKLCTFYRFRLKHKWSLSGFLQNPIMFELQHTELVWWWETLDWSPSVLCSVTSITVCAAQTCWSASVSPGSGPELRAGTRPDAVLEHAGTLALLTPI